MENLPEQGSKEAANLFVSYYRTKFGNFPGERDEGARSIWKEQIDRIEPKHIEQVVELMGLGRKDRKDKPMIDDLKRAIGQIIGRYNLSWDGPKHGWCAQCRCTGTITVAAAPPTEDRKDWTFDPSVAILTEHAFPCRCSRGKEIAEHGFKFLDPRLLERARQTYDNMLAACDQVSDTPITQADFVRLYPNGIMTPNQMVFETIVDSIRQHTKPVPVTTGEEVPF